MIKGNDILYHSIDDLSSPVLTIAIPTYQRFGMLKETLDSVFALDFTIPIEIIVVDNDPEDHDKTLLNILEYDNKNFTYYKNHQNLGMYGNWTQCLALARGKYITILHDDDLLLSEFSIQMNRMLSTATLEKEIVAFGIRFLDQRPDVPLSRANKYLDIKTFIKKNILFWLHDNAEKNEMDFFFNNYFCGTLGVIMNREHALSMSGFSSEWYPVSDYDFWCRWVSKLGPIPIFKQTVGLYRLSENESLRPEVQEGFVIESTKLRYRMLDSGAVPSSFKYFIGIIGKMQRISVELDWRKDGEGRFILLKMVALKLWRISEKLLLFTLRKN